MNIFKTFLSVVAIALLLGLCYFLTLLGPKKIDEIKITDSTGDGTQFLQMSEQLELEFEKLAEAGNINEKSIAKLREAIKMQEQYIDRAHTLSRVPTVRLTKLQTRLHDIESKPINDSIELIEKDAMNAEQKSDFNAARDLYKEAYDLQSKINAEYPLSKYKNINRRVEYDRKVKMLDARPTYLKSVEYENAAIAAREKGDMNEAKKLFEKTLETISIMHSNYPSSVYTDFARLMKVEADLQSLKSGGLAEKIEAYLKTAKEAIEKNDYLLASEAYADAAECQRSINKLYPKSILVSEDKVKEFDLKKIEAYSWRFAEEIKLQDATVIKLLQKGDIPTAIETTLNLIRKVEHFTKNFSQSKLLQSDILMRLRYIDFMGREISKVQDLIKKSLNPVEDNSKKLMLKTEVTQELYSIVMQENPSRFSDEKLRPVDSVTMEEAMRFAQRVSWLLGYQASVPTEADYRKAIGSLRYVDLLEISWNDSNSDGKTHIVATKKSNDKGFYDLLGNVSEFVSGSVDSDSQGTVKIIGGSIQTSLDAISSIPLQNFDSKQRNRTVGFRIVVDMSSK